MNKKIFFVWALLLLPLQGLATPVGPMNYQGRLLDDQGIPVTGSYNFIVKIYNAPTSGTLKYQENLNGIAVDDGVYSFKIGLGPKTGGDSLWDIDLWQLNLNNLYLEVVVNGETLSPRYELTSAPHAFTATLALSAGALGNKTAAEFDNILEGVCVSGQGKWLDKINKCLGVGATVTNETLASMMETPDTNFQNLKLISTDLTGSQFDGVNFTATEFKDSIIEASGLEAVNLTNAVMDGITFTGATQTASALNLTGATFKNMDMSKWNLSSATLTGFSAANLAACPAALPANWVCVKQHPSGSTWVLLGPGVNLSISSAARVDTFGANTLDLDRNVLNGRNLSNANLQGISFQQDLINTNLTDANLGYSSFDRINFSGANLTNTQFNNANIQWVRSTPGTIINGTNFSNAKLYYVDFSETITNAGFENATLQNVEFQAINAANFVSVLCVGCAFNGNLTGKVKFEDAGLYTGGKGDATHFHGTLGDEFILINVDAGDGLTFHAPVPTTTVMMGGTLKLNGDFSGVTIDSATLANRFIHTGTGNPGPILQNVTLNNINFNMANNNANFSHAIFQSGCTKLGNSLTDFSYGTFTGTNFLECGGISGANWNGVFFCPDGQPPSAGINPSSCEDGQML